MVFLATKAALAATIVGVGVTFGALSYLARRNQENGANNNGLLTGNSNLDVSGSNRGLPSLSLFPSFSREPTPSPSLQGSTRPLFSFPTGGFRLFGASSPSSSSSFSRDCNCKLMQECSAFHGRASHSFRLRRTCGFQGFQRKICCDDQPAFFSTPPPYLALDEVKSAHAHLNTNINCQHNHDANGNIGGCSCAHYDPFNDGNKDGGGGSTSKPEGPLRSGVDFATDDNSDTKTIALDPFPDENDNAPTTTTNKPRLSFPELIEYFPNDKSKQDSSTAVPIEALFPVDEDYTGFSSKGRNDRIDAAFGEIDGERTTEKSTLQGDPSDVGLSRNFPSLMEYFPDEEASSDLSKILARTTTPTATTTEVPLNVDSSHSETDVEQTSQSTSSTTAETPFKVELSSEPTTTIRVHDEIAEEPFGFEIDVRGSQIASSTTPTPSKGQDDNMQRSPVVQPDDMNIMTVPETATVKKIQPPSSEEFPDVTESIVHGSGSGTQSPQSLEFEHGLVNQEDSSSPVVSSAVEKTTTTTSHYTSSETTTVTPSVSEFSSSAASRERQPFALSGNSEDSSNDFNLRVTTVPSEKVEDEHDNTRTTTSKSMETDNPDSNQAEVKETMDNDSVQTSTTVAESEGDSTQDVEVPASTVSSVPSKKPSPDDFPVNDDATTTVELDPPISDDNPPESVETTTSKMFSPTVKASMLLDSGEDELVTLVPNDYPIKPVTEKAEIIKDDLEQTTSLPTQSSAPTESPTATVPFIHDVYEDGVTTTVSNNYKTGAPSLMQEAETSTLKSTQNEEEALVNSADRINNQLKNEQTILTSSSLLADEKSHDEEPATTKNVLLNEPDQGPSTVNPLMDQSFSTTINSLLDGLISLISEMTTISPKGDLLDNIQTTNLASNEPEVTKISSKMEENNESEASLSSVETRLEQSTEESQDDKPPSNSSATTMFPETTLPEDVQTTATPSPLQRVDDYSAIPEEDYSQNELPTARKVATPSMGQLEKNSVNDLNADIDSQLKSTATIFTSEASSTTEQTVQNDDKLDAGMEMLSTLSPEHDEVTVGTLKIIELPATTPMPKTTTTTMASTTIDNEDATNTARNTDDHDGTTILDDDNIESSTVHLSTKIDAVSGDDQIRSTIKPINDISVDNVMSDEGLITTTSESINETTQPSISKNIEETTFPPVKTVETNEADMVTSSDSSTTPAISMTSGSEVGDDDEDDIVESSTVHLATTSSKAVISDDQEITSMRPAKDASGDETTTTASSLAVEKLGDDDYTLMYDEDSISTTSEKFTDRMSKITETSTSKHVDETTTSAAKGMEAHETGSITSIDSSTTTDTPASTNAGVEMDVDKDLQNDNDGNSADEVTTSNPSVMQIRVEDQTPASLLKEMEDESASQVQDSTTTASISSTEEPPATASSGIQQDSMTDEIITSTPRREDDMPSEEQSTIRSEVSTTPAEEIDTGTTTEMAAFSLRGQLEIGSENMQTTENTSEKTTTNSFMDAETMESTTIGALKVSPTDVTTEVAVSNDNSTTLSPNMTPNDLAESTEAILSDGEMMEKDSTMSSLSDMTTGVSLNDDSIMADSATEIASQVDAAGTTTSNDMLSSTGSSKTTQSSMVDDKSDEPTTFTSMSGEAVETTTENVSEMNDETDYDNLTNVAEVIEPNFNLFETNTFSPPRTHDLTKSNNSLSSTPSSPLPEDVASRLQSEMVESTTDISSSERPLVDESTVSTEETQTTIKNFDLKEVATTESSILIDEMKDDELSTTIIKAASIIKEVTTTQEPEDIVTSTLSASTVHADDSSDLDQTTASAELGMKTSTVPSSDSTTVLSTEDMDMTNQETEIDSSGTIQIFNDDMASTTAGISGDESTSKEELTLETTTGNPIQQQEEIGLMTEEKIEMLVGRKVPPQNSSVQLEEDKDGESSTYKATTMKTEEETTEENGDLLLADRDEVATPTTENSSGIEITSENVLMDDTSQSTTTQPEEVYATTAVDRSGIGHSTSPSENHASYAATTEYPDTVDVITTTEIPTNDDESLSMFMDDMTEMTSTPAGPTSVPMTNEEIMMGEDGLPVTEITKSVRREPDTDKTVVELTHMSSKKKSKVTKTVTAVKSGSEASVSEVTTEAPASFSTTTSGPMEHKTTEIPLPLEMEEESTVLMDSLEIGTTMETVTSASLIFDDEEKEHNVTDMLQGRTAGRGVPLPIAHETELIQTSASTTAKVTGSMLNITNDPTDFSTEALNANLTLELDDSVYSVDELANMTTTVVPIETSSSQTTFKPTEIESILNDSEEINDRGDEITDIPEMTTRIPNDGLISYNATLEAERSTIFAESATEKTGQLENEDILTDMTVMSTMSPEMSTEKSFQNESDENVTNSTPLSEAKIMEDYLGLNETMDDISGTSTPSMLVDIIRENISEYDISNRKSEVTTESLGQVETQSTILPELIMMDDDALDQNETVTTSTSPNNMEGLQGHYMFETQSTLAPAGATQKLEEGIGSIELRTTPSSFSFEMSTEEETRDMSDFGTTSVPEIVTRINNRTLNLEAEVTTALPINENTSIPEMNDENILTTTEVPTTTFSNIPNTTAESIMPSNTNASIKTTTEIPGSLVNTEANYQMEIKDDEDPNAVVLDDDSDNDTATDLPIMTTSVPETEEVPTTEVNEGTTVSNAFLQEIYDTLFGAPSGRSARVNNLGSDNDNRQIITDEPSSSTLKTTTTPEPPFTLEVKVGPYDERSLFGRESTPDEKRLEGEISNVVSQLLLTTHKNFNLLPNFVECAGARGRTGRRKTKVLQFDTENYPWMARIGFREPGGVLFPCAGTIISRRYILTSAHCALRRANGTAEIMEILLEGAKNAAAGTSNQSQFKYKVEQVLPHPNYDDTTRENDLALIRLTREIPAFNGTSDVKPICLPFEDGYGVWDSLPGEGETAYLGGWGYGLKNMAATVEEMDDAAVTIWSNENCTYLYRGDRNKKVTPKQICAYGRAEKDACRGDSGGPLMALMTRQRIFFQIGVVSYGPRCGYGVPGVYTRVSNYLSWILDTMRP